MLCYVTLCCVMYMLIRPNAMLCYVMLRYVVLCTCLSDQMRHQSSEGAGGLGIIRGNKVGESE